MDDCCAWCLRSVQAAGLCECPHCGGERWCEECLASHAVECDERLAVDWARERQEGAADARYDELREEVWR